VGLEVHFDGAVTDGPDNIEHEAVRKEEGEREERR
jgi:hypothetical protein